MKRVWSIRPYKEGDEEGILELWKAVYPAESYDQERWTRWWHWMYKENPAAQGKIWLWLAEDDGKIVGHSAIIPIVMKIGSETVTGFQSIDTMTHPSYRHQGIYETLAKKAYAEAAMEGVHIGYRFPNKNSHPIAIKKLNWLDVATKQIVFKPYHWRNTIRLRVKNKFLAEVLAIGANLVFNKMLVRTQRASIVEGLTITRISSFDKRIDGLWNRISDQYPIVVIRNKDYLNWRYCAVPNIDYSICVAEKAKEICGYLVLRCLLMEQTKVGLIFDILAESEQIAQCLISKAVEQCEQDGVDVIYCSLITNKMYLKALKRNGFISSPFVKGYWLCAYSSSHYISKEFLKDPQNWYIQVGDSDAI